ncbi:MAG: TetR/AcrR family transcriptional regulator, partial [Lautropia sp.]
NGFHRTTMSDICREAEVSAGALYVYFESKEALIAGIAERDRSKFLSELEALATASDLTTALTQLGEHYAVEEPQHKRKLCIEIGIEATRNPVVGEIYHAVDNLVLDGFEQLFRRAIEEGRIRPAFDPRTLAETICMIGDGIFWRRGTDPQFDAKRLMPAITVIVNNLLNPQPQHDA